MKEEALNFVFDPNDVNGLFKLMDEKGDSDTMYIGTNENGENITLSISHDKIVCTTFQSNGWVRVNTYWSDGDREETFDGRKVSRYDL